MTIKFLNLNILKGKFLDKIIAFLTQNDFDILNLQEVTGGSFSFNNVDCFRQIISTTQYAGIKSIDFGLAGDTSSYFGNAIFFKKNLNLKNQTLVRYDPYKELRSIYPRDSRRWATVPLSALAITLEKENKSFEIVNTHNPWSLSPNDTIRKISAGKKLADFIRILKTKFILSGDFNVDNDSKVIKSLGQLAKNVCLENGINNTLNPRIHHARDLFPPGVAVDFLFVERSIRVKKFEVLDELDLSDHLGISSELEI